MEKEEQNYQKMTGKEMIKCLENVWYNMSSYYKIPYKDLQEMLVLVNNMDYFLYSDLQVEYPSSALEFHATNDEPFDF